MKNLTSILITIAIVISLLLTGYFMMTNLLKEVDEINMYYNSNILN